MLAITTAEQTNDAGTAAHFGGAGFSMPEVQKLERDTFQKQPASGDSVWETGGDQAFQVRKPSPQPVVEWTESETAALIQIWEGTVQEVLPEQNSIRVLLQSKMGDVSDHFADIGMEWVSPQDVDLVRPGAVFYLSLYRSRRRNGAVVNSEELRFRRLPAWTRRDATRINDVAQRLLAKGMTKPDAP